MDKDKLTEDIMSIAMSHGLAPPVASCLATDVKAALKAYRNRMTMDDVINRIAEITESKDNSDIAHGLEDKLWQRVLSVIAAGNCDDPAELANAALKSLYIKFPRHTS